MGVSRRKWDERPVGVRRFVQDESYLGLGDSVYPVVLDTLSRVFRGRYQEAVLCWGIGSGKSFACTLALLYRLYRTLCLRHPQQQFGLAEGSQIVLATVGPTARVAEKVVFGELRELVQRSPWFAERYKPDARVRRELHFPKHVVVLPGNSSETFPLGLNVLCATMDEASYFVETLDGRREAAEEVYLALQRRIRSRFGEQGLMLIASSPRHCDDFIMRKLAEAETEPTVFGSRKATWEAKPRGRFCGKRFECDGLSVPVEYEAEFRRNPQKAKRDLAALPGTAFQPYFVDMTPVEQACDVRLRHPVEAHGALAAWFRPEDREARFVHVDLGLRRDACGVAMAKAVSEAGRPVAVVELMHRIAAPARGEVDLAQVRELILALRGRGFPIAQVSYDGWQSADSQQILRRHGLRVETVSVDRDTGAYETLKELANDGRLRMYAYEPLLRELRRLELMRGVKVDHPPGGSKDVADAVAGAVSEAVRAWGEDDGVRGRIV
jgi:hypothetical protein